MRVAVVPEPFLVTPSGDLVRVQFPEGRLLSTTLPVGTSQAGWVMDTTDGTSGTTRALVMTTFDDNPDVHP